MSKRTDQDPEEDQELPLAASVVLLCCDALRSDQDPGEDQPRSDQDPKGDKERPLVVESASCDTSPCGLPLSLSFRRCHGLAGWGAYATTSGPTATSDPDGTGLFGSAFMLAMSCCSFGASAAACGGRAAPKGPRTSTGDAQLAGNSDALLQDDPSGDFCFSGCDSPLGADCHAAAPGGRDAPQGPRKSTGDAQLVDSTDISFQGDLSGGFCTSGCASQLGADHCAAAPGGRGVPKGPSKSTGDAQLVGNAYEGDLSGNICDSGCVFQLGTSSRPTSTPDPDGRTGPFSSAFTSVMSCFSFGVSALQCFCIPVKQPCHDWKQGARIGEATNPGPAATPVGDGLLDGLGLKEMIREMVREAVKEAIREAFGAGFGPGPAQPAGKDKPKGKGDKPSDKGKGKGKEAAKGIPPKGRGKGDDDAAPRPAKPGKGQGEAAREKQQPGAKDADDGEWKLVERKAAGKDFVLRQQDWDAPLVLYSAVSAELDKLKPDEIFKAVVRCDKPQRTLLQRVLQGSSRKHSVLAVTIGKEEDQDSKTQQRVPGRQGDALVFRAATVVKMMSPDQNAPQPTGMKQAAVKLVRKPTEVLVVRVSKNFATKELWDAFTKSPQRSVVQWLADRHVNALDSFSWKDEKGDSQGHQLYGLVRLMQPEALAILGASGQDGVFLDPTKSMNVSGRVTWVERSSKTESHSDYHARAIKCAGDLGLVAKGSRLAVRSTIQAGETVPKIWIFDEHVPVSVDPEQAKTILENYFSNVTMMRVRGSKGERTFYFKAAHPSDPNSDLVPINLDTGDGVITAWARVAPPRAEKFKQRQLPTMALPLEQKQTFRAATPIAVPTSATTEANGSDTADGGGPLK